MSSCDRAQGLRTAEAQRASRLHNQVMPNVTKLERKSEHQGIQVDGFSEEEAKAIESKGHKVEWIDGKLGHVCRQTELTRQ